MDFKDRLQKIRKENNITQEQLADKLNVSRQAVSKWESGTAYPDTEKLILISKLFNVSLDELIKGDTSSKEKENDKISFKQIMENCLGVITKSVDMFWAMTFAEKCKCILEMAFIVFIIFIVSSISFNMVSFIWYRTFGFLNDRLLYFMDNLIQVIMYIIWLVLGSIIVYRIFKSRYLDYYVVINDESVEEKTIEKPISELKEKKEYKVVIRDPKNSSFNIFNKLWKICLFFIKGFVLFMLFPIILLFILLIVMLVVSLFYFFYGLLFKGISIAILGCIAFTYLVIRFIFNIIFNMDNKIRVMFCTFIISLCLMGIGMGISVYDLSSFSYVYNEDYSVVSEDINMEDNLVILGLDNIDIVIDDNLSNIKLDIKSNYSNVGVYFISEDGYKVTEVYCDNNGYEYFKKFLDNIKEKVIINNDNDLIIDKIYISSKNLTKIKENYDNYMKN